MTTEEIVADLRQNGLTSASIYTRMDIAADRLEELQRDLKQAIAERTPHDYGLLKDEVEHLRRELSESIKERNKTVADLVKQRDEARFDYECRKQTFATRPEPSRLEIAAMFMAGSWAGNDSSLLYDEAWEMAGELIATAKEAL